MRALLAEARGGVAGTAALLAFRQDWRKHFNVSVQGAGRSFSGAVLALPAYALMILSVNYFVGANPDMMSAESRIETGEAALAWLRFWLVFPLAAAGTALAMKLSAQFTVWLIAHNWAVFTLIHVQALVWLLYAAGMLSAEALLGLIGLYQIARVFVHWRIAAAALGLPPVMAGAAAAIPLLADFLILWMIA